MDLPYVAYFHWGSNGIPHDGCFLWPVDDFLDGNRLCIPGINDTFAVLDGDKNAFVIECGPIFHDDGVDFITYMGLKMQQVDIFTKDWSSMDIVEQVLIVLRLVRDPPVINEDIGLPLAAFGLICNANGWQCRIGWRSCSSAEGVGQWLQA